MKRKHVITVLKLAVIAGLMAIVFSTVQWSDTHINSMHGDSGDNITATAAPRRTTTISMLNGAVPK